MNKKIPAEEYKAYVILVSKAESVWEEAKEKSDFPMFMPYLKEIVETTRRFISYWGVENGNPYNTLLDEYEPGMTTEILDNVFGELRNKIVPLAKKIAHSPNQPETAFLYKTFPKEKQKQFSLDILNQLGYDFEAGRLDETVHPFATGLNQGDVRITTKYDENDFRSAIFGTIHECGHALYEQNISSDLEGLPLSSGTSMGIHESHSPCFMRTLLAEMKSFGSTTMTSYKHTHRNNLGMCRWKISWLRLTSPNLHSFELKLTN